MPFGLKICSLTSSILSQITVAQKYRSDRGIETVRRWIMLAGLEPQYNGGGKMAATAFCSIAPSSQHSPLLLEYRLGVNGPREWLRIVQSSSPAINAFC